MSSVSVGAAFYSGFIPLVKLGICIGSGFYITRKGLFDIAASRGATQVAMKISLPCLIFAAIVPSFNSTNIAALGPLLLVAAVYELMGAVMGFVIREIFYVPEDFRWGIIAACVCSNWGNLPTAVVQSVAANPPFDATTDPTLGTAYVAIFILVYQITFFASGLCNICAWDFIPIPEEERNLTRRQIWRRRRHAVQSLSRRWRGISAREQITGLGGIEASHVSEKVVRGDVPLSTDSSYTGIDGDGKGEKTDSAQPMEVPTYTGAGGGAPGLTPILSRYRSHHEAMRDAQTYLEPPTEVVGPIPVRRFGSRRSEGRGKVNEGVRPETTEEEEMSKGEEPLRGEMESPQPQSQHSGTSTDLTRANDPASPSSTDTPTPPTRSRKQKIIHLLELIFTPFTLTIVVSLLIALVSPLKALFVKDVTGWSGSRIPYAPDGNPPLAWMLSTASFIGQICIPLSLILLGSSLARINVPKDLRKLPWASLAAVTLGKMVLLPCIGIGMVVGLTKSTNFFPEDDKMLRFVAIFLSGGTSAVNQLLIAAIYSPTGKADTTAMYIGVQSVFMFFSNSALAAVAIVLVK